MQKKRWDKIESILDTALTLSGEERTNYVMDACDGDNDLLEEVYEILNAIQESGKSEFLESGLEENKVFIDELQGSDTSIKANFIGARFGPFEITEQLGQGGMASVFKGERTDGKFSQQVAIKLLDRDKPSKDIIERFRMEQEILASLSHPNIAQLYDGGVTKEGIPYLIMEYVDGVPIDQYCAEHRLNVEERVNLFKDVCKAVQFAHTNLIIHRDIKAQNILVTSEGVVKILDFGIAKLLDPKLSGHTLLQTQPGQRFWTPQYASPEQVNGKVITTATDVYALGVLLHKLLTGTYPLTFADKSLKEIERIITEDTPEPASTSLQNLDSSVFLKEFQGFTKDRLVNELKGDLDAMILKSIRKEPEYRYNGVGQFLEDLDRYQKGLPLTAHKDTLTYRIGKFYRRNKTGIVTSIMLLLLIIGFTGFYTWRIAQERDQAQYEAKRAERVTEFVVDLFEANDPSVSRGEQLTASELLEIGLQSVDTLQQAEIKVDIMDAIGRAYGEMGDFSKAISILEEVHDLSNEYHGAASEEAAITATNLANYYRRIGDFVKAEKFTRKAMDLWEQLEGANSVNIAQLTSNLASVNYYLGKQEEAISLYREAYQKQMELLDPNDPEIATTLNGLNAVLYQTGQFDEVKKSIERVFEIYESNFGIKHPMTADQLSNKALILFQTGNIDSAEIVSRETLALQKELHNQDHPSVAAELNNLGEIITAKGKFEEAESLLTEAVAMRKRVYGEEHILLARSIYNLGAAQDRQGKNEEALSNYKKAISMTKKVAPVHHVITNYYISLAQLYLKQNRVDEALSSLIEREQEINRPNNDYHRTDGLLFAKIGECYIENKNYQEAESYLLKGFKILEEQGLTYTNDIEKALLPLIELYKNTGNNSEVVKYETLLSAGS